MSRPWEDRLGLPGPSVFIQDVADDVRAGRSAVVVVPEYMVRDRSVETLIVGLQRATSAVDCPPPSEAADLPGAIGELYGRSEEWRRSADPWRDLIGWPAWHGERVVLRSWEHDVDAPLRRLPALLQESGVPEPERPVLLIVVQRRDVDEGRLDHIDELTVRVHWWWGVLDRLDTEAYLAGRERPAERDVLRRAIVAEVSAWSLELADHLAGEWNGRMDSLEKALDAFAPSCAGDVAPATGGTPRSSFPVAADRDAWDAGLVDQWDGRRRAGPWRAGDRAQLDTLVWRAQNRVLMARVDEGRAELETAFRRRASQAILDEVAGQGSVLELGPMRWALNAFGIRLAPEDAQCLRTLCDLRNKLAHGCPADDALLSAARRHLHT